MSGSLFPRPSFIDPPAPVILRDYQRDVVGKIRGKYAAGHRRVLLVSPTGSGKGVVFAHVIEGAVRRGRRVLVLTHRQEILDQIEKALQLARVEYGLIAPGYTETDAPVQIASVATIARRLERWRGWAGLLVCDEAHHAVAGSWAAVLRAQPLALTLGVSATPERLDGRGLGEIFDAMVVGPQTAPLITAGYLSRFVVFEAQRPDLSGARIRGGDYAIENLRAKGIVVESAVDGYEAHCDGAATIVFCIDIDHSERVAAAFNARGISARHVDGDTPTAERKDAIEALARGDLNVLTNVSLFGEGVDCPNLGAVIMLRPTASLALYLQQVGRALRPAPNKDRAIILDFAGNASRHGLPDAPQSWSLDAKPRRQRERPEGPALRRCPSCAALNHAGAHECSECGADLRTVKKRREIKVKLEEAKRLEEEDRLALMRPRERLAWAGSDERRLQTVARISGYAAGWVFYRLQEARSRAGGRV